MRIIVMKRNRERKNQKDEKSCYGITCIWKVLNIDTDTEETFKN